VVPDFNLDKSFSQSEYQRLINEDRQFPTTIALSIFVGLFSPVIILLQLIAVIALSVFSRYGPKLFVLSFIVTDVIFPILLWWSSSLIRKYDVIIHNNNLIETNHLLTPLNSVHILLTGIILTVVYSDLGKHLFKKKKI